MKAIPVLVGLLIPALANAADDIAVIQPLFKTYCIRCHGPTRQKGDLRLDQLSDLNAATFEAIYKRVANGEMPPDSQKQPTKEQRAFLMQHVLELAKKGSSVATPGLRRLNKREYGHTVRDLLGLRKGIFDPSAYVYDDGIDEGFDTAAESLVISNELLLEYMNAAGKSLRHALFTSDAAKPKPQIIKVSLRRVKGTSRRYINNHANYVIGRSGGKAQLYDGMPTRTMRIPGRYRITVTAAAVDRDRYPVRFQPAKGPLIMGVGVAPDAVKSVSGKAQLLKTFELKDEVDQTFVIEIWIDKDHFVYISFVNGPGKPITQLRANVRRGKLKASVLKKPYVGPGIRIKQFRIEGPFYDKWPPDSIRTTYGSDKMPDLKDKAVRDRLVHQFAKRAFRRHVTPEEIVPYLRFLDKQYSLSRDWHESIVKTFGAMMTSLDFLYIREGQGELDSYALASRLSYFLWSTMPDDELFQLAQSGKLKEPGILRGQVERLLKDDRSKRFCTSFADQWLSLHTLGTMPPDAKDPKYRTYYRGKLEAAMLEETHRYFQHVLQKNCSVRDFIDSDYSFLNQGLAKLYNVPFKGGKKFVRITFPKDAQRGGLLGHGSILTLTANGVETSPVERGVWVLADLLGTPPPPPPKEVPALTPDLAGAKTVRDLLVKHRSDTACMQCHRRIDPLGFALEAYDPIGRLRTRYTPKQDVTTHGNYLGKDFADVKGLKRILVADLRPFARSLVIRIAEYAKGRKLVATDYPIVDAIVNRTAPANFRFRDITIAVATSKLMTHR